MATFNNGLWTPDAYTGTDAAVGDDAPTTTPAASPVAAPTTSSSSASPPAVTTSSTTTPAQTTTSVPVASIQTTFSSTPPSSSQSSSSSSASSSTTSPTLAASSHKASSFKASTYMPILIVVPILLLIAIFCIAYRLCWSSAARRQRRNHQSGVLTAEEEDGLVEGRYVKGSDTTSVFNEKLAAEDDGWAAYLAAPLKRVLTGTQLDQHQYHQRDPYESGVKRSGSYATLERPFNPASMSTGYRYRTATPDDELEHLTERGWQWGSSGASGAPPRRSESWRDWGTAGSKYRAKGAGTSRFGSSKRSRATTNYDGAYAANVPPSPSMYSVTSAGDHGYGTLSGETEEDRHAALDELLRESRVGDSNLAHKYLSGTVTAADLPQSSSARSLGRRASNAPPIAPYVPPPPPFDLPAAPRQSYVSPTKTAVVRARLPTPPRGAGDQRGLLFQYDSPAKSSTYTPPRQGDRDVTRGMPDASAEVSEGLHASKSAPVDIFGTPRRVSGPREPRSTFATRSALPTRPAMPPTRQSSTAQLPYLQQYESPPKKVSPNKQAGAADFDPVFSEPAVLDPLPHPSRVRNAIESLEKRTSRDIAAGAAPPSPKAAAAASVSTSAPRGTVRRYERPLTDSKAAPMMAKSASTGRLPVPPSPQKLTRSTTTVQYHHVDGYSDNDDDDDDEGGISEAMLKESSRRARQQQRSVTADVGNLLLARSRTSIGYELGAATAGAQEKEDPKQRLADMLRGPGTSLEYQRPPPSASMDVGLEAMLRKSVGAQPGLKSALKR